MGRRSGVVAVALVAVLAGGCGGGSAKSQAGPPPAPPLTEGQSFADDFVRRLVVGRWQAVRDDIVSLIRPYARDFQKTIRRDGVNKVLGPGQLRSDCPPNAISGAGKDCFVYHLIGSKPIPVSGITKKINSRYRIWLAYEDERWQVIHYDYDARVTPPGS